MDCRQILENCGAILNCKDTGEHYQYASGRHGEVYIAKMLALSNPWIASQLAEEMARYIFARDAGVGIFLGAQTGGAKFANYVTLSYLDILIKHDLYEVDTKILCLETEKKILELVEMHGGKSGVEYAVPPPNTEYVLRKEEEIFLREEYKELIEGKKVAIIDDVITTGKTTQKLIDLARRAGGEIVSIGNMWNRGNFQLFGNIPLLSLITEKLESWPADNCPLCQQHVPISKKYGHGGK